MSKLYIATCCLLCTVTFGFGLHPETEVWTNAEIDAANTARNVSYLDSLEKQVIMYTNLARLFPKRFNTIEVRNYDGAIEQPLQYRNSANRKSLIRELENMKAVSALLPDSLLTLTAECFSNELAKSGRTGHERKNCKDDYLAENCSFGKFRAKDIVMQLLIDEGVSSLGHRKNCLNVKYELIGVSFGDHPQYKKCTVMDFK